MDLPRELGDVLIWQIHGAEKVEHRHQCRAGVLAFSDHLPQSPNTHDASPLKRSAALRYLSGRAEGKSLKRRFSHRSRTRSRARPRKLDQTRAERESRFPGPNTIQ